MADVLVEALAPAGLSENAVAAHLPHCLRGDGVGGAAEPMDVPDPVQDMSRATRPNLTNCGSGFGLSSRSAAARSRSWISSQGVAASPFGTSQAATRLGVATDVRLAVDLEESATDVHADNFKKADVETASIDDYFNGVLGARLTALEKRTRDHVGELHLLVGGPPCQGHSDLNNHTRRDDPKKPCTRGWHALPRCCGRSSC